MPGKAASSGVLAAAGDRSLLFKEDDVHPAGIRAMGVEAALILAGDTQTHNHLHDIGASFTFKKHSEDYVSRFGKIKIIKLVAEYYTCSFVSVSYFYCVIVFQRVLIPSKNNN